jgi:hypothetical protein
MQSPRWSLSFQRAGDRPMPAGERRPWRCKARAASSHWRACVSWKHWGGLDDGGEKAVSRRKKEVEGEGWARACTSAGVMLSRTSGDEDMPCA